MQKRYLLITLLVISFAVASCQKAPVGVESESKNSHSTEALEDRTVERAAANTSVDSKTKNEEVSLETAGKSETPAEKPIERKIIRNADLRLEVDAPEEVQQRISAIAEGKGGFVVESTQRGSDVTSAGRDTVTMSLRIPAAKFNESLDEIRKSASRVVLETIKGQDVTEEFIDVEARLKTKKALEEQFIEIMKRSNSVEDALNVQRELANVRGEIEQIEGRKRFLENQSSLSTINVTLQTPNAISGSSKGFLYRLSDSLSTGLNFAMSFVLFFVGTLVAVLPFLLLIVLPIYLVIRYVWKKNGGNLKSKSKNAEQIVKTELVDD